MEAELQGVLVATELVKRRVGVGVEAEEEVAKMRMPKKGMMGAVEVEVGEGEGESEKLPD